MLTSALLGVLIGEIVIALDSAGGHPAQSAPLTIWIVCFILVVLVRLAKRRIRGRKA